MLKFLLFSFLLCTTLMGKEHVVLLENENSFFFYKEKNQYKGLYPKIFEDINKKKKINLNLKELDTNLILDMEKGKDILIMDLIENEERREKYYFIPTFFYLKANMYFLNNNFIDITNFYKKRVGVIKGTYLDREFLEKYDFLHSEIIDIETREKGLQMLKEGEVDGFVADNQYGFKDNLSKIELSRIPIMVTTLAVPKSEKKLYKNLKRYFEEISPETLKNMISDSRREYYKDKFGDKYTNLKDKSISVVFPTEKTNYPLYYIEDGEEKGLAIEYLKDVGEILGIQVRKIFYSKEEDWKSNDITIASTIESSIRDNENYTNPYYTLTPVIFNRKEDGFINNLVEARKKRFAVVENSYYMDYLRKFLKEENFIYAKDMDETIEKVKRKEADYSIGDYKTLINKLYNTGYDKEIKIAGILDKKYDVSMVVNSEQKELYEALKDISASFLNENMSKNIYLEKNSYETDKSKKILIFSMGILLISFIILYKGRKNLVEKRKYEDLMLSLVSSLEAVNQFNDLETGNHIKRLNLYSELLANKLGCSKKFYEEIGRVASLHDVGKIGIDRSILKKPGKLTEEEFKVIKEHPEIGYEIIKKSGVSIMAENIARYHHEKWDGSGYPCGLKGLEIPLEARIVSVVDVYDALRQKRVYKDGFTHEKAIEIIKNESGKSFDPNIVKIFLENEFKFERLFNSNI
ncbi:transporter substrate-binding domain-containing protein [Cetobacterium somerae]|uniref:HD domain-containing phosphohydrolase n=1 Tax=Cetobacterium somerae TaxID=188913 RepID=UPI002E7C3E9F|nr:transporter substrate-binding domain-containing protein [Cetobacterium somerae]WVJ00566.1 transporter substrate-binding domain-containing protein [Cetobacterium somerae]